MNELSRRRQAGGSILWPLLIMGGVVATVALVAIAFLLLQSQLRHRRPARNARDRNGESSPSLQSFRNAILGVDKGTILRALGPPPATIGQGIATRDDTWYYPLDPSQRLALAIQFQDDVARQTAVLRSPAGVLTADPGKPPAGQ